MDVTIIENAHHIIQDVLTIGVVLEGIIVVTGDQYIQDHIIDNIVQYHIEITNIISTIIQEEDDR